ncbi:multiple inositol polyphosphate phosphatase 1-like isoform X2 [Athalia rosae]|uniref:multiple inositol polyphosphate phosphatase 1-like isoform X2 n=1 Tax=Athalia rosae TaxID=37344 RepID=UPI0020346906|nr:multiple inositol polyphosphate phosphatase 1-like isoform X2 [Athalia rosae]XP_048516393.1 multiple inositol polyphosphate phosphatase 1-like isoform X2 [Athalia rosae]XP_048516394.1 multiple inositol polyphosphate phosphatase 1-like isoform X2 [Athalia rosae]
MHRFQEMFWRVIIVVIAIQNAHPNVEAQPKCLSSDGYYSGECHMGTKTPYRQIGNSDDSQLNYSGCTQKKIWMMLRHGTRFPGKDMTIRWIERLPKLQEKILQNYYMKKSSISAEAAEEFVKWSQTLSIKDNSKLHAEGEREMFDLAKRCQARFTTLLSGKFNNESYKIKYTPTRPTEKSAKYFALGLFGSEEAQKVWYHPLDKKDIVLRSYKRCNRWQNEVKHNPAAYEEYNSFLNSIIVEEMLDDLSERLGLSIDYDAANLMYQACALETAWDKNYNSPWCKVFSLDNLKVLEYAEDLEYYWIDSYGFNLTYQQSCPALRDVFEFFQADEDRIATLYFTHSGSLLKLLALLGLANETKPLTNDSFEEHRDNRVWRTSAIDAFASNLGFVLYDCEKTGPSILAFHQERVAQIPGCPADAPCPIAVFESIYSESINHCHFDEICGNNVEDNRNGNTPSSHVNFVLTFLMVLFATSRHPLFT